MPRQKANPLIAVVGLGLGLAVARQVERRQHLKRLGDYFLGKTVLIDLSLSQHAVDFASAFAQRGASPILFSDDKRTLKTAKKQIQKQQPNTSVFTIQLSRTDSESYREAVETALKQVGCIDILAYVVDDADTEPINTAIELSRLVMRNMVERGSGTLVYIRDNFDPQHPLDQRLKQFTQRLHAEVQDTGLSTVLVTSGKLSVETVLGADFGAYGVDTPTIHDLIERTVEAIVLGETTANVGLPSQVERTVQRRYPRLMRFLWGLLEKN